MLRILFLGDIVGRPGRHALRARLPSLKAETGADFVIANGENAASGAGLTAALARELHGYGVDVLTLGDHAFDQSGFEHDIGAFESICRPANFPAICPGRSWCVGGGGGRPRVAVFTVLGRSFMRPPTACPLETAERLLAELAGAVDVFIVEIHAETTAEKATLARALEGRVAAVLGTHTHVPTADAVVWPGGTAFQTDLGMCGPYESIIGREIGPSIAALRDGMKRRFPVAKGDVRLAGALIEVNPENGRAVAIRSMIVPVDLADKPVVENS